MSAYPKPNLDAFMLRVNAANSHFDRVRASSLRPLIAILKDNAGDAQKVRAALVNLSAAKQAKYWEALLYLRMTYNPAIPAITLAGGGATLGKRNAALFGRNANLPAQWATDFKGQAGADALNKKVGADPFNRTSAVDAEIASTSNNFLDKSLEHFIVENPARLGAVLIHMGAQVDALGFAVAGRTHLQHLISTLDALAFVNAPLCILHQKYADGRHITENVCESLRTAVAKVGNLTTVWTTGHAGGKDTEFMDFIAGHDTIVAMGYDGDVCVGANCFGTHELNDAQRPGGAQTLVVPIINQANIVTSRTVLVSDGTINKVKKWGVICNT